jgi:putative transposase
MSRPLRIEFPGAVYHVTSRGDRREAIYGDDADRVQFLNVLEQALRRFHGSVLAYCLMTNHYHLVLQTQEGNLSLLMRHLNGVYTQLFNRRYGLAGHLFQGRFKAILVDADEYLMSLCRYVELNPVRAGMVAQAQDWAWSSYRSHTGLAAAPAWLDTQQLADFLLGRRAETAEDEAEAVKRYCELVTAPAESPWVEGLRQQIYLGDEDFVMRMQERAEARNRGAPEVAHAQRAVARTLPEWLVVCSTREEALRAAHVDSAHQHERARE